MLWVTPSGLIRLVAKQNKIQPSTTANFRALIFTLRSYTVNVHVYAGQRAFEFRLKNTKMYN